MGQTRARKVQRRQGRKGRRRVWQLYELDPDWFRARGEEPPKIWMDF